MPLNDTAVHAMLDALDESVTQITHVGIIALGTGRRPASAARSSRVSLQRS